MSEPAKIGDILRRIAEDPDDDFGKILRRCPFFRDEQSTTVESAKWEDWIDGQEVMQKLHISPRTLQTLRSNGTIPYTRIGHKLYYLRQDIERILRDNYVMFNIRQRYGKDD